MLKKIRLIPSGSVIKAEEKKIISTATVSLFLCVLLRQTRFGFALNLAPNWSHLRFDQLSFDVQCSQHPGPE